MADKIATNVRLTRTMHEDLKSHAKRLGVSSNSLIVQAVDAYLRKLRLPAQKKTNPG